MKQLIKNVCFFSFLLCTVLVCNEVKSQILDTVCVGSLPVKYMVSYQSNSKYKWTVKGGIIISQSDSNVVHISWGNNPGLYEINVVEINQSGCYGDSIKSNVIIKGPGAIQILGKNQICEGEAIWLKASHVGYPYIRWSTGENKDSIVVSPPITNRYFVIGYDAKCGNDTSFKTVAVVPKPSVQIETHPKKPRLDDNVYLSLRGSGALTYKWYYKGETSPFSIGKSPMIKFSDAGEKEIFCIVDNGIGCVDTVYYKLVIGERSTLFLPNVFSPNNDNVNDIFYVKGTGIVAFTMEIFDRWGKKLFYSNDMQMGWDGTYNGEIVQDGSYVVIVRAMGEDGKFYAENTSLTLIK